MSDSNEKEGSFDVDASAVNMDGRNQELFAFLNDTIRTALLRRYGAPKPEDNMPARVAVSLMAISLRYFAATQAPKSVVLEFLHKLVGDVEAKKPASVLAHPALEQIARFGKG